MMPGDEENLMRRTLKVYDPGISDRVVELAAASALMQQKWQKELAVFAKERNLNGDEFIKLCGSSCYAFLLLVPKPAAETVFNMIRSAIGHLGNEDEVLRRLYEDLKIEEDAKNGETKNLV